MCKGVCKGGVVLPSSPPTTHYVPISVSFFLLVSMGKAEKMRRYRLILWIYKARKGKGARAGKGGRGDSPFLPKVFASKIKCTPE